MNVRELFQPHPMGVNATLTLTTGRLGGFIPTVAGTLTLIGKDPTDGTTDVTLVNAVPVTAGIYLPLPISLNTIGGRVVLAGGAAGTLLA